MGPTMTCPDCGVGIDVAADLTVGRRVHRLTVQPAGPAAIERATTVVLWHCANCAIVIGVS